MTPRLVLFDDARARDWQPFTLTRPAGELLFGAYTLRARAERTLGLRCAGHVTAPELAGFSEPDAPGIALSEDVTATAPCVFLSSRAVVSAPVAQWPAARTALFMDDECVGWFVPAGEAPPRDTAFTHPDTDAAAPRLVLHGSVLHDVWDLVVRNPAQVAHDARAAAPVAHTVLPGHVHVLGDEADILLGERVTIEPGVVLDTTHGPIWLEDDVTVHAFTRIAGPTWVGRGSTLLGGPLAEVSIGPVCKVHGEIEASVVLGYTNKAHDGFLGHAYLGRWVNLGALTTNSDLKNNYGTIRLWTPAGDVDTGQMKIGCLLGDHVKTGIGTMLNTGTVVGAGSNLFGSAMPPKYVPPFSWGSGTDLVAYDFERFVQTAETAAARRGIELDEAQRGLLLRAWQRSRGDAG